MFPDGFPHAVIDAFVRETGVSGVLGNCAASGTDIIERLGPAHLACGEPIIYTSADSVFQIAAHTDQIALDELYALCRTARGLLDDHRVGRVIARPFVGGPGTFERTYDRKDYSMAPSSETALDRLTSAGRDVFGVGKIFDIFAGRGVGHSHPRAGTTTGSRRRRGCSARCAKGSSSST